MQGNIFVQTQQMFTAEQIKAAHSKVKSGADFPAYIQEIKALGVTGYEAYVSDGHVDYHNNNGDTVTLPKKYDTLTINPTPLTDDFKKELAAHQQGKTDYLTFITMCADKGIEKWKVDLINMHCTYFDTAGNAVLQEAIPG